MAIDGIADQAGPALREGELRGPLALGTRQVAQSERQDHDAEQVDNHLHERNVGRRLEGDDHRDGKPGRTKRQDRGKITAQEDAEQRGAGGEQQGEQPQNRQLVRQVQGRKLSGQRHAAEQHHQRQYAGNDHEEVPAELAALRTGRERTRRVEPGDHAVVDLVERETAAERAGSEAGAQGVAEDEQQRADADGDRRSESRAG